MFNVKGMIHWKHEHMLFPRLIVSKTKQTRSK